MKLNNIFNLRPKDNSKVGQSYWKRKPSIIPIWKQKNDDGKLGGKKEKSMDAYGMNEYLPDYEEESLDGPIRMSKIKELNPKTGRYKNIK